MLVLTSSIKIIYRIGVGAYKMLKHLGDNNA